MSVATWAVVAALGVGLVLRIPTAILTLHVFGSPVALALNDTTLMAVFLALLAAVATESAIRSHPRLGRGSVSWTQTWVYWALPAAISILAAVLTPAIPTRLLQVAGMLVGGLLVAITLYALYATVDSGAQGFRRARILLNILAYGSALALFLLVYQTRARSLISGTEVAVTAMLLAVELLRSTTDRTDLVLSYAIIVGLILGEATWALNYLLLPGLTGSLLLLLLFYLSVGLAQQGLQEHLTRRVVLEFVLFAVFALVLIALVGPGF